MHRYDVRLRHGVLELVRIVTTKKRLKKGLKRLKS